MSITRTSQRARMRQSMGAFLSFFTGSYARLNLDPDVSNFAVGNPQEMPLPGYVAALQRHVEPRDKDWFAYKLSEPESQRVVAETLSRRTGLAWDPADVAMTTGGFSALAVAMRTLVDPGDEVIFLSPPWFFYELLILAAGGEPVRVVLDPPDFEPDLDRIDAAIRTSDTGDHHQQPTQPERQGLSPDAPRRHRRAPHAGLSPGRASGLGHQRRALQPDRVRRPRGPLGR